MAMVVCRHCLHYFLIHFLSIFEIQEINFSLLPCGGHIKLCLSHRGRVRRLFIPNVHVKLWGEQPLH